MFYCETCRVKNEWPKAYLSFSRGNCELCGKFSVCHDVPSKALTPVKIQPTPPDPRPIPLEGNSDG